MEIDKLKTLADIKIGEYITLYYKQGTRWVRGREKLSVVSFAGKIVQMKDEQGRSFYFGLQAVHTKYILEQLPF